MGDSGGCALLLSAKTPWGGRLFWPKRGKNVILCIIWFLLGGENTRKKGGWPWARRPVAGRRGPQSTLAGQNPIESVKRAKQKMLLIMVPFSTTSRGGGCFVGQRFEKPRGDRWPTGKMKKKMGGGGGHTQRGNLKGRLGAFLILKVGPRYQLRAS